MKRVDLPDPVPDAGELVIDVKATGLCHSDVSFMTGEITSLLSHLPIVLGHEIAGVVSAVGAGVNGLEMATISTKNMTLKEITYVGASGAGDDGGAARSLG